MPCPTSSSTHLTPPQNPQFLVSPPNIHPSISLHPHSLTPPPPRLSTGDLVLDLVQGALVLDAGAVHQDAGALDDTDEAEEEVDGGEEVVLGGDDEAPAGPDQAGGGQGAVLLEGELLGGAGEVGDAGEDEGPLGRRRELLATETD